MSIGRYVEHIWNPNPDAYGSRRSRRPGTYQAFIPDPIAQLQPLLSNDEMTAVADAEVEATRLDEQAAHIGALEVLARQLLRSEAVGSSRIEGLQLSHRRLARAAASDSQFDTTATSILGNVRAMEAAIDLGSVDRDLTASDIATLHRVLMMETRDANIAGTVRVEQNWIGATSSPIGADFVPPPPEHVPELLDDLAKFLNRTDLPATVQAAVAHAQFETIHPFADGNGRVGRCLVHTVLRRQRLVERVVPPVSLVLASNAGRYISGLTAFRDGNVSTWISLFADALHQASIEGMRIAHDLVKLREKWEQQVAPARMGSAARRLLDFLALHPRLDASLVQELLAVSHQTASAALTHLEQRTIIARVTDVRRNRVWEVREVFDLLDDAERRILSLRR